MAKTSVALSNETKELLDEIKVGTESYDSVISRLAENRIQMSADELREILEGDDE